jgi:WD40 repeat protein
MGNVNTICYSDDGRYLLTSSEDKTAKLWDAVKGKLIHDLRGHSDVVYKAVFTGDGSQIVTLSRDGYLKRWDIASGREVFSSACPGTIGSRFSLSPDARRVLTEGETMGEEEESAIFFWQVNEGGWRLVRSLPGMLLTGRAGSSFSPDGKTFVFISEDGSLNMADVASGRILNSLGQLSEIPEWVEFSSDGRYFAWTQGAQLKVWDTGSGRYLADIPSERLAGFRISYDGRKIALVTEEGKVNLHSLPGGEPECSFESRMDQGLWSGLEFSRDGRNILVILGEGLIYNHDLKTGAVISVMEGTAPLAFSRDGRQVATAANASLGFYSEALDQVTKIWESRSGRLRYRLGGNSNFVSIARFSPDGKRIVTDSWDGTAKLWDVENGKLTGSMKSDRFRFESVSFSRDGSYILTIAGNETAGVWSAATGNLLLKAGLGSDPDRSQPDSRFNAIFSPDSRRLMISHNDDSIIRIYDIGSGRLSYSFICSAPVNTAVFDNRGTAVAASSADGSAWVWNLADGTMRFKSVAGEEDDLFDDPEDISPGERKGFSTMVFSPDDRMIASTTMPGRYSQPQMEVCNAENGEQMYSSLSTGYFYSVSDSPFSTDGRLVAADFVDLEASGDDLVIKTSIIDPETGLVLHTLPGITRLLNGTLENPFSPDGKSVLTLDGNKFSLWDLSTGSLKFSFGWSDAMKMAGSAFFSPAGKFLLTGSFRADEKGYITGFEPLDLWDLSTGKVVRTIDIGQVRQQDIDWERGRIVTVTNSVMNVFGIGSGDKLYSFVALGNEDYVFMIPSGEYMGTIEGVRQLSWKLGDRLFDFSQWDLQYNRPDRVMRQLGNSDTVLISMYEKAYLKRLRRSGFGEEMFYSMWHAPETEILNQEELSEVYDDFSAELRVRLSDSKYMLNRLNVWINDVPLFGRNGMDLAREGSGSLEKTIPLDLSPGLNRIQVSCINEKGVESLREWVDVQAPEVPGMASDLYLVAISVSAYSDSGFNLRYAVKDGRDIVSMMAGAVDGMESYGKVFIDTLFDLNATRENFLALREKLLNTGIDDRVVLFASGHGLLDENLDFWYATHDIDFGNPSGRGISFYEFEDLLDSIPARKKLLLLDACHSGEVDMEEEAVPVMAAAEPAAGIEFRGVVREYEFEGTRGDVSESGIGLQGSFELMQELFAGLDRGTGTVVISAAAGKGYALESPEWNNGVFTWSILEGLKSGNANVNRDQGISVSEVRDYSKKRVGELTGGRQMPTARRGSATNDWILMQLRHE